MGPSITAQQHVQRIFNGQGFIFGSANAGAQLARVKHADAQRVQAQHFAANLYGWIKALCQPGNEPLACQWYANTFNKAV